ncbi:hypothetical protein BB559_002263 [Furculomyces boomerangus]|uniref:Gfd2/YDR514C-like C-terminal domain-containing protein n=1 Tax=Furculomyces boomerangus TaxID=61424 RepID=A0A2T9YWP5_9FUNG|nr:hypothetical protein BB559_002263 [Furculomyces boomerangus]
MDRSNPSFRNQGYNHPSRRSFGDFNPNQDNGFRNNQNQFRSQNNPRNGRVSDSFLIQSSNSQYDFQPKKMFKGNGGSKSNIQYQGFQNKFDTSDTYQDKEFYSTGYENSQNRFGGHPIRKDSGFESFQNNPQKNFPRKPNRRSNNSFNQEYEDEYQSFNDFGKKDEQTYSRNIFDEQDNGFPESNFGNSLNGTRFSRTKNQRKSFQSSDNQPQFNAFNNQNDHSNQNSNYMLDDSTGIDETRFQSQNKQNNNSPYGFDFSNDIETTPFRPPSRASSMKSFASNKPQNSASRSRYSDEFTKSFLSKDRDSLSFDLNEIADIFMSLPPSELLKNEWKPVHSIIKFWTSAAKSQATRELVYKILDNIKFYSLPNVKLGVVKTPKTHMKFISIDAEIVEAIRRYIKQKTGEYLPKVRHEQFEKIELVKFQDEFAYRRVLNSLRNHNINMRYKSENDSIIKVIFTEWEKLCVIWKDKTHNFISINVKSELNAPENILEIGWTIHNASKNKYLGRHFILDHSIDTSQQGFMFGSSKRAEINQVLSALHNDILQSPPVIITGHEISETIKALDAYGLCIESAYKDTPVSIVDTMIIAKAYKKSINEYFPFEKLMEVNKINFSHPRNSGNDSAYNLMILFKYLELKTEKGFVNINPEAFNKNLSNPGSVSITDECLKPNLDRPPRRSSQYLGNSNQRNSTPFFERREMQDHTPLRSSNNQHRAQPRRTPESSEFGNKVEPPIHSARRKNFTNQGQTSNGFGMQQKPMGGQFQNQGQRFPQAPRNQPNMNTRQRPNSVNGAVPMNRRFGM